MSKHIQFDKTTTKGHLCTFYKDDHERLETITEYIRQGLANNELCIFVTSRTKEQTCEDFAEYGVDISDALSSKRLLIFEMHSTYIKDGRFIASYMLNNVQMFIDDAKKQGYSGLRTAGEMNWLSHHPEAVDEAIEYEYDVNGLEEPSFNFVGLCMYATKNMSDIVAEGALRTHPTLLYNGNLTKSPFYAVA